VGGHVWLVQPTGSAHRVGDYTQFASASALLANDEERAFLQIFISVCGLSVSLDVKQLDGPLAVTRVSRLFTG